MFQISKRRWRGFTTTALASFVRGVYWGWMWLMWAMAWNSKGDTDVGVFSGVSDVRLDRSVF